MSSTSRVSARIISYAVFAQALAFAVCSGRGPRWPPVCSGFWLTTLGPAWPGGVVVVAPPWPGGVVVVAPPWPGGVVVVAPP
ncbi:MAG: hypothetical protein H0U22_07020, partial [Geodermatophilaceae bacterium]|nr:hypothetical protein [Geodermatophilaceae bacterium]